MAQNSDDSSNKNNGSVDNNSSKPSGRVNAGGQPLHNFPEENSKINIPFAIKPMGFDLPPGQDDPDSLARNAVSGSEDEIRRTIRDLSVDGDEATAGSGYIADAAARTPAAGAVWIGLQ